MSWWLHFLNTAIRKIFLSDATQRNNGIQIRFDNTSLEGIPLIRANNNIRVFWVTTWKILGRKYYFFSATICLFIKIFYMLGWCYIFSRYTGGGLKTHILLFRPMYMFVLIVLKKDSHISHFIIEIQTIFMPTLSELTSTCNCKWFLNNLNNYNKNNNILHTNGRYPLRSDLMQI